MNSVEFILYVADQAASRNFYSTVLLAEPVLDVPGMTEFALGPHSKLGLMPETGIAALLGEAMPHPSTGGGIPRCELYLFVDDPERYIQRVVEAGGKAISPVQMRNWGDRVGYAGDPDGHILAFAERAHQA